MTASARETRSRPSTRETIFEAALTCFERAGISATAMEDIAVEAGTSRQTIYNHFDSKQTLILEVLAYRAALILDQVRAEIAWQPPTIELIVTAAIRNLEISLQDPIARQLASPVEGHLMSKFLLHDRMMEARRAFWLPLLQAAQEQGQIHEDLDLDDTVTWLIFVLFSLGNHGADFGLHGDRLRPTLERYLSRGIART